MNFQFLVTNHDLRVLIRNYVDCSVGSLKACMERLASDVYAIANQKKDPQGRTLSITADDLPTKKSAHHLQEKLTQSGQIPKTQLWRLFPVDAGSAANMRVQNYTYKNYVMDAPSDSSRAVRLYALDSSRHKNQMYYFGLQ